MKSTSAVARATSKPATRATNAGAAWQMSPEPSPPSTGPRRSTSAASMRQPVKTPTSASSSRKASPQHRSAAPSPPLGSPNSPRNGNNRSTSTTRRQTVSSPSTTVKGFNSQPKSKQIFSLDLLAKTTPKTYGPSMLTRSIDESHGRRHSAPRKPHDYLSKSHDHGSLAAYRQDRGPKSLSKSHNQGPMSLSKSQDRGFMSRLPDKGFMSKSHDRGSLSGYVNQSAVRKATAPAYGFDGRRLSTGSRDVSSGAHRISDIKAHYQSRGRDVVALQLQMGRSVDSTVSLSTVASSRRQSFRLSPRQEEETAAVGRRPHRQLKSPDFFDVKKVDGDAPGVITAVSRMHVDAVKTSSRRDSLTGSARKVFTTDVEINYKLDKELHGTNELLEIGSWNEDDEEYLRIYKGERCSTDGSFVDILEDESSCKPGPNLASSDVGQFYQNALYDKSEPESDLGTSTQPSPHASPPRTVGSRIPSNSATSTDLSRSSNTTFSAQSQYDSAFWSEAGTVHPWTPLTPPPAATDESRLSRCNDGLERLTSYMKTANQGARKRHDLSDDLSSSQASGCFDYLVDFLESQQSITDVLVSAHDQSVKSATQPEPPKDLSSRSIESRVTDLGSEASWESGKSRSVQTLGTTGKVMDQITEKVDSLSFDSPKHLSTFKFGLKKTTVGAFETITSSDQDPAAGAVAASAASQLKPQLKPQLVSCLLSPISNLSWRSQTAPSSQNPSRTPSQRMLYSDHEKPSPLSTSTRQINVVSEGAVEFRSEQAAPPEIPDSPRKVSPRRAARQTPKSKPAAAAAAVEAPPVKDVQMHDEAVAAAAAVAAVAPAKPVQLVESASMKVAPNLVKHDSFTALNQANKGCGCNIL